MNICSLTERLVFLSGFDADFAFENFKLLSNIHIVAFRQRVPTGVIFKLRDVGVVKGILFL